jgi:hypothetical protein
MENGGQVDRLCNPDYHCAIRTLVMQRVTYQFL